MNTADTTGAVWPKNSRSNGQTNCVEVTFAGEQTVMRDSKNPTGSTLTFAFSQWEAFLGRVSSGAFKE